MSKGDIERADNEVVRAIRAEQLCKREHEAANRKVRETAEALANAQLAVIDARAAAAACRKGAAA